jgi:hypothetical protein
MNALILPVSPAIPTLIRAAGDRAQVRFLEFFAAQIRNPHTRRAYVRAVTDFLAWCEAVGVDSLAAVQPLHVAAWIEAQTRARSAPTVKLRSVGNSGRQNLSSSPVPIELLSVSRRGEIAQSGLSPLAVVEDFDPFGDLGDGLLARSVAPMMDQFVLE